MDSSTLDDGPPSVNDVDDFDEIALGDGGTKRGLQERQ